jgi:hypothetical protein
VCSGVLLVAIVDESVQCVLLNDDVDPDCAARRKRLCCCTTGSLCWTASDPTSTPSWATNVSDWFDVSGDRVRNVTRFRLSRASPTTAGTIRLMFEIGSTPGFDDGALGSFHGSRRVTQFLQWDAPSPLARVTQAELRLAVSSATGS